MNRLLIFLQSLVCSLLYGEIRFEVAQGEEMLPYLQEVVKLSDAFYSQYPYLYEGTQTDEAFYTRLYGHSDGWLMMAFEGDRPIGYAIGGPMSHIHAKADVFPLIQGQPMSSFFLLGEITLLEPYRGRQIGQEMVKQMEDFARTKYANMGLTQIDEESVPLPKPKGYRSNDPFWLNLGYTPHRDSPFSLEWRNVGETEATAHTMFYWSKSLVKN